MPFAELSAVKHRLQLGVPLPFNVRDADRTLLLARGFTIASAEQLEALLNRGALVDMAELMTVSDQIRQAPRQQLPRLWQVATSQLNRTLLLAGSADSTSFRQALGDASAPLQALVERDPDLAIFQVLRQDGNADADYGAGRSLQTAVTSLLVAQRLGWESDESERAFKVALTMNLSMLELQGQMARQALPPTPQQRVDLQTHPMRSVRLLEAAGISDPLWLRAVLEHHENETGSGYPSGSNQPCELASLVRRSDVYTSKLAFRSSRDALAADLAGRQMFMQEIGRAHV